MKKNNKEWLLLVQKREWGDLFEEVVFKLKIKWTGASLVGTSPGEKKQRCEDTEVGKEPG